MNDDSVMPSSPAPDLPNYSRFRSSVDPFPRPAVVFFHPSYLKKTRHEVVNGWTVGVLPKITHDPALKDVPE
jgi:hypothetical protein